MTQRVKLAAVQAPPGRIDGPVADLDRLEALTAEAAGQGARLVAWPECAYPAYFLRSAAHYRQAAGRRLGSERLLERVAGIARRRRVFLVAGLVEETDDGRLANAAMLFDPSGRRLASYRKCFLWHFDTNYFVPGEQAPVVQTEIGRIGMMICADGRCPELAAIAGRRGAQILVNPTAWVSWGRTDDALTNPQIEYFIPARAIESGCWVLSANKAGVEADSIAYCGRSNLVDPSGTQVAALGPAEQGVLLAEADLSACRPACSAGKPPDPVLFEPTESLPVTARRGEPVRPDHAVVAAAVSGPLDRLDPDALLADLSAQSVRLLVLPPGDAAAAERWVRSARRSGMMARPAGHAAPDELDGVRVAGGPVDSYAPARAAMLNGAELFVAAADRDGRCPDLRVLRARASENRVYVVAAADDRAVFISPLGAVQADSLAGRAMAVVVRVSPAAARDKLMAPGTDVVASRNPAMYARHLLQ